MKLFKGFYSVNMGDGRLGGFGLLFPLLKWTTDWQNQKENCSEITIIQVVDKLPDGSLLKDNYRDVMDDRDPSDPRWLIYRSTDKLSSNNILNSDGVMDIILRSIIQGNMALCPGFPVCPPNPSALMNLLPLSDLVKSIIDI